MTRADDPPDRSQRQRRWLRKVFGLYDQLDQIKGVKERKKPFSKTTIPAPARTQDTEPSCVITPARWTGGKWPTISRPMPSSSTDTWFLRSPPWEIKSSSLSCACSRRQNMSAPWKLFWTNWTSPIRWKGPSPSFFPSTCFPDGISCSGQPIVSDQPGISARNGRHIPALSTPGYAAGSEAVKPIKKSAAQSPVLPSPWKEIMKTGFPACTQIVVGSQDFLPVYHDLHTLQITDRQGVQRIMQRRKGLRSDAVHHHFCAGVARQDKVQYASSDLAAASSDKDMGRNRQIVQTLPVPVPRDWSTKCWLMIFLCLSTNCFILSSLWLVSNILFFD